MRRLALVTTAILLLAPSPTEACNIPVFRYALERWLPDNCEVLVFHEGSLSLGQKEILAPFEQAAVNEQSRGLANLKVKHLLLNELDDESGSLWEQLQKQGAKAPYMVVRTVVKRKHINNWHGPLEASAQVRLLSSPVRQELLRRTLSGHSVVWLVAGADADQRAAMVQKLQKKLGQVERDMPLPDGIGLPGSELYSSVPLFMRFSVLELDTRDPNELYLSDLFHGFEPKAMDSGQPVVVPVFGRGRALEVIPGEQINEELIDDLSQFLCGACSCQVKEQNPGFDLLMAGNWHEELFGDLSPEELPAQIISVSAPVKEQATKPESVPIPDGRADETEATTESAVEPEQHQSAGRGEGLWIWCTAIAGAAVMLLLFRRPA